MMRRGTGSGVLGILAVVVCFSGGCGSSRYDTPQSTFEAAKSAALSNNCTAFCDCLTLGARDEMAAGLVMVGRFMQLSAMLGGPDTENAKDRVERIKAVFEKHGFGDKSAPKVELNFGANDEGNRRELVKLVAPIKDRNAFIGDFLRVLIETADKPDAKLVEPNARLVDLKIESETATATFAQTREGKEKTSPIEFKKVDGAWKISRLPRLMS